MPDHHIKMKNVASYHATEEQVLDISKQNTIVYGMNGAGKSTISNFLYSLQNDQATTSDEFLSCSAQIDGEANYFVYNQKFIDDVFADKDHQQGVFTLSKDNVDIERKKKHFETRKDKFSVLYSNTKSESKRLNKEMDDAKSMIEEEVFKVKRALERTALSDFLTGHKYKNSFYQKVISVDPLSDVSLDDLIAEINKLHKYKGNKIGKITLPTFPAISEKNLKILQEPFVTSGNTQFSEFVNRLDNLTWVVKGKSDYLKEGQTTCPFCQRETIDDQLRNHMENLFDDTYKDNLNQLNSLLQSYSEQTSIYIEKIKSEFQSCPIDKTDIGEIAPYLEALNMHFRSNLTKISDKIENPSLEIEIEGCEQWLEAIEKKYSLSNHIIDEINDNIDRVDEVKGNIANKMWRVIHAQTQHAINLYNSQYSQLTKSLSDNEARLKKIERVGKNLKAKIEVLLGMTTNIDDTIKRINQDLERLGITGFTIEKNSENDSSFRLHRVRTSQNSNIFKSLSEGEKTLITFLYFVEMCRGSISRDSAIHDKEKIIVIDDPISSLSQNYIYEIASLIQSKVVLGKPFRKVIILTHSLFFYQEMIKLASGGDKKFEENYSLYRITKNNTSIIQKITKNEMQNDYESLWQIVKDVAVHNSNPVVLPNVMRNILEYYFGFLKKTSKLHEEINKLAIQESDHGFKAFYRYINRQSHSDPINTGFMIDVAPDRYIEKFEELFKKLDQHEHFEAMYR
ncbi:AAA family ATPase [Endozoicomonas sp. GU-1]|uniref:AAA family ATPase n=1 Tax=Endozoicomonas sp. GU-1 TaxID=3009078 RepID=UPI0022B5016C|nr:AAA family ATPase [Endozoicomonas sp. GU-1]WBA79837.1 AAA family ATPase [Endozoicomonas sp. GU-1]WBA87412.1 AAA family ATPase [Endozoicomonas sp. GU-1]